MSTVTGSPDYDADTYAAEWRAAMEDLAGSYAAQATILFAAWQTGRLSTAEWRHLFAQSLLDGIAAGSGVGDGLATRLLHLTRGHEVLPAGEGIPDVPAELARLDEAVAIVTALVDTAEDPTSHIQRLATSEPVAAAQRSAVRVYARHHVSARVHPTDEPVHRHPGCTCVPFPVGETVTQTVAQRTAS
jgi:hypothetical protein